MTRPILLTLGLLGFALDALARLRSLPEWLRGVLVARAVEGPEDAGGDWPGRWEKSGMGGER